MRPGSSTSSAAVAAACSPDGATAARAGAARRPCQPIATSNIAGSTIAYDGDVRRVVLQPVADRPERHAGRRGI